MIFDRSIGRPLVFKPHLATFVLAVLGVLALPAGAEEVTLKFATINGPQAHLNVHIHHPWAKRVSETGQGTVKIDVRDGMTLANPTNVYTRVVDDVVQIGWGLNHNVHGKFPRSEVAALPFLADKSEPASIAYWKLYQSGLLAAEYDEIVPLYVNVFPQTSLHLAKPPASIDDLRGLKISAGGRIFTECLSKLGAAPISLPLSQAYEAIQRGVVDGVAIQWTGFQPFKLAEVTKYHVDAALGASTGMVFMAKKKFEALPEAARKMLAASSGEAQSRAFGAFWDKVQDGARAEIKASRDHTVVDLTVAQDKSWRERLAPITAEWIKTAPDGAKVYETFRALLDAAAKASG
jgi:TRAP-type C4-dicarboxylate transport system substrate-binding protein